MEKKLTPMLQQWEKCKNQAKGALLLFRLGDFYEAFFDDAATLSSVCDLTLTKRQSIPMSGVPFRNVEFYIDQLVSKGYRVAIAEQMEEASEENKLVERKIVRVVTPGTLVNSSLINEKLSNYVACLTQVGNILGFGYLELTTGEFKVIEFENVAELDAEISKIQPSEYLLTKKFKERYPTLFERLKGVTYTFQEEFYFDHKRCALFLLEHFKVSHLDGFGLKGKVASINAAGGLISYLKDDLGFSLSHIQRVLPYSNENALFIDPASERNLELLEPLFGKDGRFTLLHLLDKTSTPMGGRKLREWLKKPLKNSEEIWKRQEGVACLTYPHGRLFSLIGHLSTIRDLERLIMRISSNMASPKDIGALAVSLEKIAPVREALKEIDVPILKECFADIVDLSSLVSTIQRALVDEPPFRLGEGAIFKEGHDPLLDELKEKRAKGVQWFATYQNRLKDECGLKNLKIGYNKICGYYIEVSKGQAKFVPPTFYKKQTLTNCERFTTTTLKEYERDLLSAEEKIDALEKELFEKLRFYVASFTQEIFQIAKGIGILDVLLSLARVALEKRFIRPVVDEGDEIEIFEGRHPIVESVVKHGEFIPNNTHLNLEKQLMIITGPNMAGKSTYIRQVALIVIMAQLGSFVPATRAKIGVIDKIFTRIGASDDLSRGQSTFMVEMSETANILHNATKKSLVILDEIGRGTSTYDGVAIALAVAEYLLSTKEKRAKTLFATHYIELTLLAKRFSQASNFHAKVCEEKGEVLFLHKIAPGIAPKSYGIGVAKLAGLPLSVISRAEIILSKLEKTKELKAEKKEEQLLLF